MATVNAAPPPPPGMAEAVGLQPAAAPPPPPGMEESVADELNEIKYGGPTEQAKAAAEGLARGLTAGGSDIAETKLGISTPERIKGRQVTNPITSGGTQMLGAAGLIAATGGVAAPLEGVALGAEAAEAGAAAEAAAETAGMSAKVAQAMGRAAAVEKAGAIRSLGATAFGYGVEGAGFGAANVISDMALGDPDLNAQKISAELGMGALLGTGFGVAGKGIEAAYGKFGFAKGSLSEELSKIKGQNISEEEASRILAAQYGLKPDTKQAFEDAKLLGVEGKPLPVTPAQISASPWAQQVEDILAKSRPSFAGIAMRKQLNEGYEGVRSVLTNMLGEAESEGGLSKAGLGQVLQSNLTSRLDEEAHPINQLYSYIKGLTENVPLKKNSLTKITENIMALDEVAKDPQGPAAKLAERLKTSIEAQTSVDDVKRLRKVLQGGLQQPSNNERFVMGQIQDRLKDLEDRTITAHANAMIKSLDEKIATLAPEDHHIWADQIAQAQQLKGLVAKKQEADALYGPFITKVKTLAEKLGFKRVDGVQSAIHFIKEQMTPEMVSTKLFSKGDSEFAQWFSKQFPHEFELIKQWQRTALRDTSVTEQAKGFDPRVFLKKVFAPETETGGGMAPEKRALLFNSDELEKMKAAQRYLRRMPKDFNPSHTSYTEATREFFSIEGVIGNLQDFGMYKFLHAMAKVPAELRPPPTEMAAELGQKFDNYTAAQSLIDKTDKAVKAGVKAIFSGARGAAVGGGTAAIKNYSEKEKRIAELSQDPEALASHVSNHLHGTTEFLPNISQSMASTMTNAAQFLESKRPKASQEFTLAPEFKPSEAQKAKFVRYYDAVANPVAVLDEVKRGRLTPESLEAMQATHPDLLNTMRDQINDAIKNEKAMKLPPAVKLSLARFLGRPLNGSMTPQVAMANQAMWSPPAPAQAQGNQPRSRSTQTGLAKLKGSKRMTTDTNEAEEPV